MSAPIDSLATEVKIHNKAGQLQLRLETASQSKNFVRIGFEVDLFCRIDYVGSVIAKERNRRYYEPALGMTYAAGASVRYKS